jgi:large subunit ribosomal protein L7/L12
LEEQVRLLAAGMGIEADDPAESIAPEVVALAREGKTMQAIRLLRKQHGLGLLSAKRIVDAARAE